MPASDSDDPAGQDEQVPLPIDDAYVPALHTIHCEESEWRAADVPASDKKVPRGHAMQRDTELWRAAELAISVK